MESIYADSKKLSDIVDGYMANHADLRVVAFWLIYAMKNAEIPNLNLIMDGVEHRVFTSGDWEDLKIWLNDLEKKAKGNHPFFKFLMDGMDGMGEPE